MQLLRHNWPFKLLSLAGAITVALFVYKQEDRLQRTLILPVTIAPPVGQRVVEPPQNFQVYVDVEGPAQVVRSIENKNFQLVFDASKVTPGVRKEIDVTVEQSEQLRGKGLDVSWRPRKIPVLLVSDKTKVLPIVIKPVNRPDGWQIKDLQIKSLTGGAPDVTVSGPVEMVDRVAQVVAAVPLDSTEVINELVQLQPFDSAGNKVEDSQTRLLLAPTQVLVSGMQERVVLQKPRVPVQPMFTSPVGARISVQVLPRYVRIVGPERAVSETYVVETEPIIVAAGQNEVVREVQLVPPKAGITVTPTSVRVTLRNLAATRAAPPGVGVRPGR